MQYRVTRTDQTRYTIEHGLFGNKGGAKLGSTWDHHLYIARQKTANGWRYFYSQAELAAAQAKQTGQKVANTVKAKASTAANETSQKYGIPQQKKFPMPDAKHVRSAIKFFNYVDPKYEKQLANAILARMREYGMSFEDFNVGEENRFSKYIPESGVLTHHGILGQKWGVRRYQNSDGTLTPAGRKRLERADKRWVKKNEKKIYNETFKQSRKEINDFVQNELDRSGIRKRNKNGKISAAYANAYSKRLAQIMNKNARDIESPSGRVVRFVAMRGEMKVATALADRNYDINQLRSGVYSNSGKIAYQKKNVGMMRYD